MKGKYRVPGGCARGGPNMSVWSCVLSLGGWWGLEQGQSVRSGGACWSEAWGRKELSSSGERGKGLWEGRTPADATREAGCQEIVQGSTGTVSLKDLSYPWLTHSPQLKWKRILLKGTKTLESSRRARESSAEVRKPEEYSDQPRPKRAAAKGPCRGLQL